MAFSTFRTPFEFVGQLEILKERQGANGKTIQGTIQTNEKGTYIRVVFGTKLKEQGSILLEATSFNNPVTFTLNEVDSKGVAKKFEYSGGKPLTEEQKASITDLWKSTYKIKGKNLTEYHHSKDFITDIRKNVLGLVEKGGYFKITGNVEKSVYQGNIQERYVYDNIEYLVTKPQEEYLKVTETVIYKKEDIKDKSMAVYQAFRTATKQGYKEVWYKGDKVIKFDKKYILNGNFDYMDIEDNIIFTKDMEHLKEFEKGKVCINYYPVHKSTEIEEKPDISQLQGNYKIMYDKLIEAGLKEKAKNLLTNLSKNIKVAEGGNNRQYYLNEFMFTDTTLEIVETVFDSEYYESTPKLIDKAMSKEMKGKMKLDDISINKKRKVDVAFDGFNQDDDFGNFEDNTKDSKILESDNKEEKTEKVKEETKKEDFDFEKEMEKDENVEKKEETSDSSDDDITEFPF